MIDFHENHIKEKIQTAKTFLEVLILGLLLLLMDEMLRMKKRVEFLETGGPRKMLLRAPLKELELSHPSVPKVKK